MRNLLPAEYQRRLQGEYRMRLATTGLLLASAAVAVGAAALAPSYFVAQSKLGAVRTQANLVEQSIAQREEPDSADVLATMRMQLEILSEQRSHVELSSVIAAIIERKPAGVALTEFVYEEGKEAGMVTVAGTAARRDALLAFRDALEGYERFAAVTLPVSNLAPERDISFTLRIAGDW